MDFVAFILGIIVVWAGIGYISNRRHSTSSYNSKSAVKESIPKPIQNKILPNILTYIEGMKEYKARFENGVIYRLTDYGSEYVIGYYDCENGNWKVRCVSDKGEIATIDVDHTSALISFNRLGDLARHKRVLEEVSKTNPWLTEEEQNRQHNNAIRNTKLSWMCAETFAGFIQDITTYETIAKFSGSDLVGASAAFVCLQYEVVMEGKYHSFFKPIN